ncbi:MAG TPA: peptidoglycan-binding protein [Gaiellaceae bacterium]|nr:peptidoglycan-binding protein [Gaiellaceae bacterium]
MGDPALAALQVGLIRAGVYHGPVDGLPSRRTEAAVRAFQLRRGLTRDGVPGQQTRKALGRWASYELGQRTLMGGMSGWDVAELQFLLAWHGFPSARFNGVFGSHVLAAVKRFQRYAGLPADGIAGGQTLRALRGSRIATCPIELRSPTTGWLSSPYGPRWLSFHPGIDLAASLGTPVTAAAPGRVSWAAPRGGGWGNLVVIQGRDHTAIFYAHLSQIDVALGQEVKPGQRIGLIGSTGNSTGPHLYLEVRVDNATVDPLPALQPAPRPALSTPSS